LNSLISLLFDDGNIYLLTIINNTEMYMSNIYWITLITNTIWKESLNSDGQQFYRHEEID